MDALPGPCAASKHTARCPAGPHLCAKAAAEPAPLGCSDFNGGARCASSYTVAIAHHVGSRAGALRWVRRGSRRVAVRASESARTAIDARRFAANGVVAVRRCIAYDLKINKTIRHIYVRTVTFLRTRFVRTAVTSCDPAIATPSMATGLVSMNVGRSSVQRQESIHIVLQ